MRAYIDYCFQINGNAENRINQYLLKQVNLHEVLEKTRSDIRASQKTNSTYSDTAKIGEKLTRTLGSQISQLTATICAIVGRELKVFDSFEGLPPPTKGDKYGESSFSQGFVPGIVDRGSERTPWLPRANLRV